MIPSPEKTDQIFIHDITKAREMILKHGAAVYVLKDISKSSREKAIQDTNFYANVNNMFKTSVPSPTLEQKLNPKTVPKQRVPMAAQGFINEYFLGTYPFDAQSGASPFELMVKEL